MERFFASQVQYMIVVTCHASVYTLVLMSLDRYLAVVHPITSMNFRTEQNALLYVKHHLCNQTSGGKQLKLMALTKFAGISHRDSCATTTTLKFM